MNDRKRKGSAAPSSTPSTAAEHAEGKRRRVQPGEDYNTGSNAESFTTLDYGNIEGSTSDAYPEAKPSVFVKRGANLFVPMVPLDMLPQSVAIAGIRAKYTLEDVEQLRGQMVFGQEEPGSWKVEIDGTKVKAEPDEGGEGRSSQQVPSHKSISDRLSAVFGARSSGPTPSATPGPRNTGPRNTSRRVPTAVQTTTQRYNPTTPGVLGQKVYCTHWMRTGECDFTQQGCMFLHCMPDLDTLEKLGFRSYPRWFREMPRQYQVENSKEFDTDGLNAQRLQMREMSHTPMPAQSMPAPPPPPSNPYSARGTAGMYDNRSQFPQFEPYSTMSPGIASFQSVEPVASYGRNYPPPYGTVSQDSSSRKRSVRNAGVRSGAPSSTRSLLSRDASPTPSNDGLQGYSSLTPAAVTPEPFSSTGAADDRGSGHHTEAAPAYAHTKRFQNTHQVGDKDFSMDGGSVGGSDMAEQ